MIMDGADKIWIEKVVWWFGFKLTKNQRPRRLASRIGVAIQNGTT